MKKELRKIVKAKRDKIYSKEKSEKIRQNLFSSEIYKNSTNILCYYSIGSEVSTCKYFNDISKNWFLPRIDGENMLICPYSSDNLCKNKYNIPEPMSLPVSIQDIDLIIIPALCADKKGYRIGYGKGYYDRFLKHKSQNAIKVVLTYSDLFIDDVFHDEFDERCDYVITEKGIYKC